MTDTRTYPLPGGPDGFTVQMLERDGDMPASVIIRNPAGEPVMVASESRYTYRWTLAAKAPGKGFRVVYADLTPAELYRFAAGEAAELAYTV